jgi:hypothetical protein
MVAGVGGVKAGRYCGRTSGGAAVLRTLEELSHGGTLCQEMQYGVASFQKVIDFWSKRKQDGWKAVGKRLRNKN